VAAIHDIERDSCSFASIFRSRVLDRERSGMFESIVSPAITTKSTPRVDALVDRQVEGLEEEGLELRIPAEGPMWMSMCANLYNPFRRDSFRRSLFIGAPDECQEFKSS